MRGTVPGAAIGTLFAASVALGAEEGVIVEVVTMDPARKTDAELSCRGYWARDVPWVLKLFRVVEAIGGVWYGLSGERKRRARQVSSGG